MRYWLFKSEPSTWSWDDQVAKGDAGEEWDGVRNYQARNHMRDMKVGDLVHVSDLAEFEGVKYLDDANRWIDKIRGDVGEAIDRALTIPDVDLDKLKRALETVADGAAGIIGGELNRFRSGIGELRGAPVQK